MSLARETSRQDARYASRLLTGLPGWVRGLAHLLPEIALTVLAAYLWYRTGEFRKVQPNELGPDFWPQLLCIMLGVTAGVRGILKAVSLCRVSAHAADLEPGDEAEPIARGKAAVVMVLAVGYVLGVIYLGYPLASALFLMTFLWCAGWRNWLINVPVSVIGALVFAYTFQKIVFVAIPTGVGVFDAFTVWLYRILGIY